MYTVLSHLIYTVASLSLAVWVGRNLHRNGRIFVIDAFHGDEVRADAVNQLLLVGFYLLNIGFISLFLQSGGTVNDWTELIETCSIKLGIVSIVLGCFHHFNMFNLNRLRRKGRSGRPEMPRGSKPTVVEVEAARA